MIDRSESRLIAEDSRNRRNRTHPDGRARPHRCPAKPRRHPDE
jgi:hypothetical protein